MVIVRKYLDVEPVRVNFLYFCVSCFASLRVTCDWTEDVALDSMLAEGCPEDQIDALRLDPQPKHHLQP